MQPNAEPPDLERYLKNVIAEAETCRATHPSVWADECLYMLRNAVEQWQCWQDDTPVYQPPTHERTLGELMGLFTHELEERYWGDEPASPPSCTPDKLHAYLLKYRQDTGKSPTLAELKKEFGGVLGVMVDAFALQRQGRLP